MRIIINDNQIKYETEKAYLISLPHSNNKFWYPKSLTEYKGKRLLLKAYKDFEIKVFDKISYEKQSSLNLTEWFPSEDDESYLIVEEPKKIDKEVKIPDELRNDRSAKKSGGEVRKD